MAIEGVSALARRMLWPSPEQHRRMLRVLHRTFDPDLEQMKASLARVRQHLELVAEEPLYFPCRVHDARGGVSELSEFVPGDSLEVMGVSGIRTVAHFCRYQEGWAACLHDLLPGIERDLEDFQHSLYGTDRDVEGEALALVRELPLDAWDELSHEHPAALAERNDWLRKTIRTLRQRQAPLSDERTPR